MNKNTWSLIIGILFIIFGGYRTINYPGYWKLLGIIMIIYGGYKIYEFITNRS